MPATPSNSPGTSMNRACFKQCQPALMTAEMFANAVLLCCLGALYIIISASMVAFNKYLIHEDRFPFAVPLVLLHSGFCSVCALLMFLVKPSLFPSLTSPTAKVAIDRKLIFGSALPVAVLFSLQLVLSNTAYLHSSVAFLQMMKECNLVLVYMFSLMLALEGFSWDKTKLIIMILIATTLTVHSEINFSWTGFALQGTSQIFESLKITMQAVLLSSAGAKLDVLTYVLVVMPLCFCILGSILLVLLYVHPTEQLKTPLWSDIVTWWPILAANASLAFALNITIASFMQQSSALAFILSGIVKDAFIVIAGVLALHESISQLQVVGFVAQLFLILVWSAMKIFPERFEGGVLAGIAKMLNLPGSEAKSLLIPEPTDLTYGTDAKGENSSKETLRNRVPVDEKC